MAGALKNVVVIGGSYVGMAAAKELATSLPATHRVLLIEPHSHFNHLFAFPRFAVVSGHEHMAFIPYTGVFAGVSNTGQHSVVKAKVLSLQKNYLDLDRQWQGSNRLSFDYAIVASGTRLQAPGSMPHDEKAGAVDYFKSYQKRVKSAKSVVIVGGGAVGVQLATDLKEVYPEKEVTLVHSRNQLMPLYHEKIHEIITDRFKELGVNLITGARAVLPAEGWPTEGTSFELQLNNGQTLTADLVIPATGQVPNNQFLSGLEPSSDSSIVNPANGFVRVLPTLQFQDPKYTNLFAVGDIADSGAHKAARPGLRQAEVVAKNVLALIKGQEARDHIEISPPAIHLSLGLKKNIKFRNPNVGRGESEPSVTTSEDGQEDMNIKGAWVRRGVKVEKHDEYHL